MESDPITYQQLDDLLVRLGFSRDRVEPKWIRYEHAKSDTLIVLPEKKRDEPVRITDAVSARRHLIEKGLITAEELETILSSQPSAPPAGSPRRR
jgi:hypothetical protein